MLATELFDEHGIRAHATATASYIPRFRDKYSRQLWALTLVVDDHPDGNGQRALTWTYETGDQEPAIQDPSSFDWNEAVVDLVDAYEDGEMAFSSWVTDNDRDQMPTTQAYQSWIETVALRLRIIDWIGPDKSLLANFTSLRRPGF